MNWREILWIIMGNYNLKIKKSTLGIGILVVIVIVAAVVRRIATGGDAL